MPTSVAKLWGGGTDGWEVVAGGQKADKRRALLQRRVDVAGVRGVNTGSAKPLYVSSIVTRASSSFLHLAAASKFSSISSFALSCSRLLGIGQNSGRSWPKFGPRLN
jgi:hypothetical protein